MPRQKVTTFLWFGTQAEDAANFYVSLFRDSRVTQVTRGPTGAEFVIEFELAGIQYIALNGGPKYKFNEAISLSVDSADQAEIGMLWEKLSAGGSDFKCGWLKDKYGLSWQIVPTMLLRLMADPARQFMWVALGLRQPAIFALAAGKSFSGELRA
jgi:predicted 3-demethylubiquinone-9 3-methyltransferase (glyoxalase superfamily)